MSLPVLSDETTLLVLVEDAADDVICDHPDCSRKAAWSTRCEGCSTVLLSCTPCKILYDAYAAQWQSMRCKVCGYSLEGNVIPWLPL